MTAAYRLYVFDYNYSSWSMRAGVMLRAAGVAFDEVRINLNDAGLAEVRNNVSGAGLLPVLVHGERTIWDSLAIAEYLNEEHPGARLWPADPHARAVARSASCEMHSGFSAMRSTMNMNIRARYPNFARSPDVDKDVRRVQQVWTDLKSRFGAGGPFLCGEFGIVDAMFTPVVMRFRSYDVTLSGVCAEYAEAILHHPAVRSWLEEARKDTFVQPKYEYTTG